MRRDANHRLLAYNPDYDAFAPCRLLPAIAAEPPLDAAALLALDSPRRYRLLKHAAERALAGHGDHGLAAALAARWSAYARRTLQAAAPTSRAPQHAAQSVIAGLLASAGRHRRQLGALRNTPPDFSSRPQAAARACRASFTH